MNPVPPLTMDQLNAIQLVITFIGTIGFPVFAFYIKARIMEQLMAFKLELAKQLGDARQDEAVRAAKSEARYVDLERRVAVTESGHDSISGRLDSLIGEMRKSDTRREARGH